MKKLIGILITIIVAGAFAVFFFYDKPDQIITDLNNKKNEIVTDYENGKNEEDVITPEYVLLDVPFFPQAPTAKWSDPRQQDGCEEASILMAHLWLTGKTMTLQQAEQEIITVSEWEKSTYGEFVDRSITDTGKMFEEYYKHSNYEVKRNITKDDIREELAKGNLVIVPTNGQILNNPNYTAPGPLTHMLPIIGYDDKKGEFITNDPGTRNGRQYRFTYGNMMDSIYDYQTGSHEGYHKTEPVMMVIEKS
jgi:hypothetical protein